MAIGTKLKEKIEEVTNTRFPEGSYGEGFKDGYLKALRYMYDNYFEWMN